MLRLFIVPLAAAGLLLSAAADARPIDCSAEGFVGASRCLIATERVQTGRDLRASRAHRSSESAPAAAPVAMWSAAPAVAAAGEREPAFTNVDPAVPNDDPPFMALLLATVGIVGFMLHRRGGG